MPPIMYMDEIVKNYEKIFTIGINTRYCCMPVQSDKVLFLKWGQLFCLKKLYIYTGE